jgi:hypothetical protein
VYPPRVDWRCDWWQRCDLLCGQMDQACSEFAFFMWANTIRATWQSPSHQRLDHLTFGVNLSHLCPPYSRSADHSAVPAVAAPWPSSSAIGWRGVISATSAINHRAVGRCGQNGKSTPGHNVGLRFNLQPAIAWASSTIACNDQPKDQRFQNPQCRFSHGSIQFHG